MYKSSTTNSVDIRPNSLRTSVKMFNVPVKKYEDPANNPPILSEEEQLQKAYNFLNEQPNVNSTSVGKEKLMVRPGSPDHASFEKHKISEFHGFPVCRDTNW